jgi:small redox-active disulfide protein 2
MNTIQILGTGCPKCKTLEKTTRDAVAELGIDAEVIKEEDITKIMQYGIMRTPGLVFNEKLLLAGRVPSLSEVKNLLTQNQI